MKGSEYLKEQIKTLPEHPGIYQMINKEGEVLYVGKARSLKNRVNNYTRTEQLPYRLQRMVSLVEKLEITVTRSEAEALLLESSLIKSIQPRFNIQLKDDKSFPYIEITSLKQNANIPFARIRKHRGEKKKGHFYYGPFASAGSVNNALTTMQKAFLLRPCTDSIFKNRTRPCLEYQIKRCSAPCVDYISKEDYQTLVDQAVTFLEGKNQDVQKLLTEKMEIASDEMEYEQAAVFRNRIQALNAIQKTQIIHSQSVKEADMIALADDGQLVCIHVFFIRNGQTLGNKAFFPKRINDLTHAEMLEAFLGRFYQSHVPAKQILLSHELEAKHVLEEAFEMAFDRKTSIHIPQKGEKKDMMEMALSNAKLALERERTKLASERELLDMVQTIFQIETPVDRIEVFDNSHLFGAHAVGGMIVTGESGFIKEAYRKFTVDSGEKHTGGDDFYMMEQVLTRRYGRLQRENPSRDPEHPSAIWPSIVLIDGGAAHLEVAIKVFNELGIKDVPLICIAKGPDRNAGKEIYHQPNKDDIQLPQDHPVAYFMQRIRDEAHRYAIGAYRKKHGNSLQKSALDSIAGVGRIRKKQLLQHFGSVKDVADASIKELMQVEGINKKTAQIIKDSLSHTL